MMKPGAAAAVPTAQQVTQIAEFASERLIMLQFTQPLVQKRESLLVLALLDVLEILLLENGILERITAPDQWLCK